MNRQTIVPPGWGRWYRDLHFAPAVVSGDLVFISGCTGVQTDGSLADDPETQIRQAFESIAAVLAEAGAGFADVVELTSYHVHLQDQAALFLRVKDEFIDEPYPAWTAIGVSELLTPGAIVEIRVIARLATS